MLLEDQLTWNIPLLCFFLCIIGLYVLLLKRGTASKILSLHPMLFFTGVSLLYLMIGSPLTSISHLSFSFHMMQMSMLYFIIPPILLFGIPASMFQHIYYHSKLTRLRKIRLPSHLALYIFASLFLIYHLPIILQFITQHAVYHIGYSSLLFGLALSMWWPIAAPDKANRLKDKRKKRYTFLSGLFIMPACILFIMTAFIEGSQNPFLMELTVHLCVPEGSDALRILPPPFHTKYDQVIAGVSMMGMHKFSLLMTLRLDSKLPHHEK